MYLLDYIQEGDKPNCLQPIYDDMYKLKESINNSKKFLSTENLEWWQKFFVEKENEGK